MVSGNVGFGGGTKYSTDFGRVVETHEFIGDAVQVTLSTGGAFICGTEQLIYTDRGWTKAKELKGLSIKDIDFVDVVLCGKRKLFDLSLNTSEHCYEVIVDGVSLLAHNIPSIGGLIISETSSVPAGDMYCYISYKATKTVYRAITTRKKTKMPNVDMSRLVELGGPFEKIGAEDESIGGGNQKMG